MDPGSGDEQVFLHDGRARPAAVGGPLPAEPGAEGTRMTQWGTEQPRRRWPAMAAGPALAAGPAVVAGPGLTGRGGERPEQ